MLAFGGMVLLMLGVFAGDKHQPALTYLTVALLVVVGGLVVVTESSGAAFNGALIIDDFARFVKVLVLGGAALVLIMGQSFLMREKLGRFEFPVLVVFSVLGMMLMASAGNFMTLYLGLELQSLALYVLAAFDRDNVRSTEAGLKYFVLGALSSGMMLYGISLIYGFTGTTGFADVAMIVSAGEPSIGLTFGLVFLIAGLAFKVSAVPFHMWTPDVYEGAPTPITAFFAASPKIAAMALFARTMIEAVPGRARPVAADHHLHLHPLDGARRVRRHRPEQHQAPDGVQLDRQYGLHPGRARRRHAGRRAGRPDLSRDLSRSPMSACSPASSACGAARTWSRTSATCRALRRRGRAMPSSSRC